MVYSSFDLVSISIYLLITFIIYKKGWFFSFYSFFKFILIAVVSLAIALYVAEKINYHLPVTKLQLSLIIQAISFVALWRFISFKKIFFKTTDSAFSLNRFIFVHHIDRVLNIFPSAVASFFVCFFAFTVLLTTGANYPMVSRSIEDSIVAKPVFYDIYFAAGSVESSGLFNNVAFKQVPAISVVVPNYLATNQYEETDTGGSKTFVPQAPAQAPTSTNNTQPVARPTAQPAQQVPVVMQPNTNNQPTYAGSSNTTYIYITTTPIPTPTPGQTTFFVFTKPQQQPTAISTPIQSGPTNQSGQVIPTPHVVPLVKQTANVFQPQPTAIPTPIPTQVPQPVVQTQPVVQQPTVAPAADISQIEQDIFRLTNDQRTLYSLPTFTWSDALANVARAHSQDMTNRNFFDHVNPDGKDPFQRMLAAGINFRAAAENIAGGPTADTIVTNWMHSPEHKANILNPALLQLGVGVATNPTYGYYATQDFTN
ncbi:MAG TPA: CAP domain-containing protein [Patescibacteria group bacterium]|nr:CAP domain-containing protein [Patescibacteria group bacterium]